MNSLDRYGSTPGQLKYPEATGRHVRVVLGTETDEKILQESFRATENDYGSAHVIKPTGSLVSPGELWKIRTTVLDQLADAGLRLGTPLISKTAVTTWDRVVGAVLLEHIDMDPFQRFNTDAWTYLTVHLFPEFPEWRFPGRARAASDDDETESDGESKAKASDRVFGGRRNVLWRVWFRAFILGPELCVPAGDDPMGEDELDNLFGRPTICRNHVLARGIVETVYRNQPKRGSGRHFVVREFLKEIRRRYSTVNFPALGDELAAELDRLWTVAVPAGKKAELVQAEKQKNRNKGKRK